jgi:GcrA cell cycle regulator
MLALQARYGSDFDIAAAVNLTRNAVSQARKKLGVPAHKQATLWTETNIELLKELWAKGMSAREIAQEIGGKCTRNSVIGKAHRLDLPARPSPIKATGGKYSRAHRRKREDASALLRLNQPAPEMPDHGRVDSIRSYQADTGPVMSCQWIEREPGTPMCGKRSHPGKSYCAEHHERAYMRPKKDKAA